MSLRLLKYNEIDPVKWERLIDESPNGLIYSKSFYLDNMCAGWNAIIKDDYEAVMALPWKRKWGITYLYQPAFIQQLGIVSREETDPVTVQSFLSLAGKYYQYAEITLNFKNTTLGDENFLLRNNFLIVPEQVAPLDEQYLRKRINRAFRNELEYCISADYRSVIKNYRDLYKKHLPAFHENDYNNFEKICQQCAKEGNIYVREIKSKGKVIAEVILLKYKHRLYNLVSCISNEGKKKLANYFLFNWIVKEFVNQGYTIDLEGSDVPGIAFFYKKFANKNEPYPFVKFNNLPWLFKILKP